MLSNSSLALEIITHDGHQHDGESAAVEMHDSFDVSAHNFVAHDFTAHNSPAHGGISDSMSVMPTMDHGAEDCVCDDICCVSSIEFASAGNLTIHPFMADSDLYRINHYQSIALELLLPPPTA